MNQDLQVALHLASTVICSYILVALLWYYMNHWNDGA